MCVYGCVCVSVCVFACMCASVHMSTCVRVCRVICCSYVCGTVLPVGGKGMRKESERGMEDKMEVRRGRLVHLRAAVQHESLRVSGPYISGNTERLPRCTVGRGALRVTMSSVDLPLFISVSRGEVVPLMFSRTNVHSQALKGLVLRERGYG